MSVLQRQELRRISETLHMGTHHGMETNDFLNAIQYQFLLRANIEPIQSWKSRHVFIHVNDRPTTIVIRLQALKRRFVLRQDANGRLQ